MKEYVIEFEADLKQNLLDLQFELQTFTYQPRPITTFIVKDPKTRKIGASDFRDRIVHHALCNIISPILGDGFIFDSFANRKGKGTHPAIRRFEKFLAQSTLNHKKIEERERESKNSIIGYVLKADIRHYFETIDHEILRNMIRRKIKDEKVMWLIETIIKNHKTEVAGRGMPLGNFTSQFFANVYLHELDLFVKHKLKARHYIRYVDDFVILHRDDGILEKWKHELDLFLKANLKLELHPEKSRIIPLKHGITFLGFRIFPKYRLLKKSNARRIWKRLERFRQKYNDGGTSREEVVLSLEGWLAYAKFANTYKLRKRVVARFRESF